MQPPLHAALITTLALAGCFVDPGVGEGGTGEASGAASTGSTSSASATQGGTSAATTTSTATSGATDTADTTAGADLPGLCGLPVGAFTFGAAVHLAALSSAGLDSDPIFWGDLRLYFSSRPDTNVEIFVTTRASLRGAFGEPALASDLGLNGSTADAHPHLSADGLRVVFATDREGGAGESDLWFSERQDANQPFPGAKPLPGINSTLRDFDPWLSADGLRLYYNTDDGADTSKIRLATRGSIAEDFPTGAVIPELDGGRDASPFLTADERVLVFTSNRSGNLDLWMASRLDASLPFDAPVPLDPLNSAAYDGEPTLSPSGCELVFVSDRTGTLGSWDLFVAPVIAL